MDGQQTAHLVLALQLPALHDVTPRTMDHQSAAAAAAAAAAADCPCHRSVPEALDDPAYDAVADVENQHAAEVIAHGGEAAWRAT